MKHPPALGAALCAALFFTPLVRAQDLYVGSNTPANTLDLTNGTNAYANTFVGFTDDASNNALGVYNAGTLLTNTSDLFVGSQGSGNTMTVADGAVVAAVTSYMGSFADSSNNSVLVTGTNSMWQNSSALHVGFSGNGNRLVISNGGAALNAIGYIGFFGSDNIVEVTGAGSLWTNSGDLYVGVSGSSNSLVIADGGKVANTESYIGFGPASSNNSVLVTGAESVWTNSGELTVSYNGSGNSLVISNGGTVRSVTGSLGSLATATGNSVLVTGTNSLWTNTGNLTVGNFGSGNRLVVSNGGTVTASGFDTSAIGFASDNNSVLVTGSNSLLSVTGGGTALFVGYDGASNSLVIADGGRVSSINGIIGFTNTAGLAIDNSALVTGAGSRWDNVNGLVVGFESGNSTLTVADGGTVDAGFTFDIASQAGSSGTLNIGRFGTNDTGGTIIAPTITFGAGTGAINFNQSDAVTITSVISGAGTLNQLGAGTTTLSGANTYSGATTIEGGELVVSGSISNNALLYVGNEGSGNSLVISHGGTVANADGYIGVGVNSSNNSVLVSGTSSLWANGNELLVGGFGSGNSLVISNGGTVASGTGYIGFTDTASNNSVLVTGEGSAWNGSFILVGFSGSSNSLVISDGGTVANVNGVIGTEESSSNNSVLVTGTDSLWTNSGELYVGGFGSGNSLVISNGGTVASGIGYIGFTNTASNNSVLVTGEGSAWNGSSIAVGLYSSGNSLVISDGGTVAAAGDVFVGISGSSNSLVISNGGDVFVGTNLVISAGAGASNNSVSISGGSLTVTNGQIDIGRAGSGTLNVTGGTVAVKELLASNGTNSVITFNGGTIISEGTTIDSGTGFIIGDTGSGATFIANGGTHNIDTTDTNIFTGLIVGNSGSSNSLVISNGGTVQSGFLALGGLPLSAEPSTTSSNNSVLVTGEGSAWNGSTIAVGFSGSGNSMVISNGGTVANGFGYIGDRATSSNNSALVTGSNSVWTNSGEFIVGLRGTGNTLTLADGGALAASNIIVASVAGSSGTLNIGRFGQSDTGGTILAPTIAFGDGTGAINFNQRDAVTITSAISGAGTIHQLGGGATTLSASNTYTGATTVSAGRLVVDGSIASSAVTVQSGGTLGGSGTVGSTTIESGGTISPGNSPGNLTVEGNLVWNGGGNYNWQVLGTTNTAGFAAGTTWDLLTVTGTLDLTALSAGSKFNINLWSLASTGPDIDGNIADFDPTTGYEWLAVVASNITGFDASSFEVNYPPTNGTAGFSNPLDPGYTFGVRQEGGNLYVAYEVVPEPSTYALLAVAAAGCGAHLLRRRKRGKIS